MVHYANKIQSCRVPLMFMPIVGIQAEAIQLYCMLYQITYENSILALCCYLTSTLLRPYCNLEMIQFA